MSGGRTGFGALGNAQVLSDLMKAVDSHGSLVRGSVGCSVLSAGSYVGYQGCLVVGTRSTAEVDVPSTAAGVANGTFAKLNNFNY